MRNVVAFFLCVLSLAAMSVSAQEVTEFERLVAELGLERDVEDLSDVPAFWLPEPRLAYCNLTLSSIPRNKLDVRDCWMTVYDGQGHKFRKRVRIHGQGGYSLRYVKKNFSCKFCEKDWTQTETSGLQFGDWVEQDGFHFKAFYTDFSRGIGEICYKMFARLTSDREPYYVRAGIAAGRARCFPDGFPCIVYLNGDFQGVYAWQLKKHRKNMAMKKSNALHVHLDGNINDNYLFRGKVTWTQFEVRNPAGLYKKNGTLYDGNTPSELMDEKSSYYNLPSDDETVRQAKQRTAAVKASILRLSKYHSEFTELEREGDIAALKAYFEQCFDLQSLLDYVIFFYFTANGDGSLKNWQWFTYDGQKWMVAPYDMDQCLGLGLYGQIRPAFFPVEYLTSGPFYWLNRYYRPEIRQRWHELRRSGAMSAEALVPYATDWCERVGDFYAREKKRWPESPCYCEAICNFNWQVYNHWEHYTVAQPYSATTTYHAGDFVKLEGRLWQATGTTMGVYPFTRNATPDSLARLQAWIPERIAFLDKEFEYVPDAVEPVSASRDGNGETQYYTLSGVRVARPTRGIYIIRRPDGSTRKVSVK